VALVVSGPATAANVPVGQCNGINDTPGLTTTCDVVIINNLTNNPGTTGSSVTLNGGIPTTSSDLVTSVTQCNNSGNGGGGTLTCSVSITNNIAVNGPAAASATVPPVVTAGATGTVGCAASLGALTGAAAASPLLLVKEKESAGRNRLWLASIATGTVIGGGIGWLSTRGGGRSDSGQAPHAAPYFAMEPADQTRGTRGFMSLGVQGLW